MSESRKAAIVHYRSGRTDGVSLEIEKRRVVLNDLGCEVRVVSGPVQERSDFVIDELEFSRPDIVEIKENSFKYFRKDSLTPSELLSRIQAVAERIRDAFLRYHAREKFDLLLLHNIFSHGRHIAAASAFADIARTLGLPVIATHHDYYWEREEYREPTSDALAEHLGEYVPPNLPNITHVSINSLAQARLRELRNIDSALVPDVLDFSPAPWREDAFNSDLPDALGLHRNDLIVLQATRIVGRKNIETAIALVKRLRERQTELRGKTLYNGRILDKTSDIVLVLAGYAEEASRPYLERLKKEIAGAGIRAVLAHDRIRAARQPGERKIYSLWDAYVHADLVTYPSFTEGWGNQFIEAVFARKPVVAFEYPVFRADIKPEGYFFISLGNRIERCDTTGLTVMPEDAMSRAVEQTLTTLTSERTTQELENNFRLGRRYHDLTVLRHFLAQALLCC